MTLIYQVVGLILIFFIYNGFIILGKKFNNRFLIVIAWLGIIMGILYAVYYLSVGLFIDLPAPTDSDFVAFWEQINSGNFGTNDIADKYNLFTIVAHLIETTVFGLHSILFGIALFKIRKKIKYAKTSGILNMIAGATMIISIGYFIMIAAMILEILLFFEASKIFELKTKKKNKMISNRKKR